MWLYYKQLLIRHIYNFSLMVYFFKHSHSCKKNKYTIKMLCVLWFLFVFLTCSSPSCSRYCSPWRSRSRQDRGGSCTRSTWGSPSATVRRRPVGKSGPWCGRRSRSTLRGRRGPAGRPRPGPSASRVVPEALTSCPPHPHPPTASITHPGPNEENTKFGLLVVLNCLSFLSQIQNHLFIFSIQLYFC